MLSLDQSITVLNELREQIIPLGDEELSILEQNIVKEGCREPLIVWEKKEGYFVLVDGHNRLKICKRHNIPFKTKTKKFANVEEAKVWMIDNQMGRRNLTPDQMSYYRGVKYNSLKKPKGGYENVKSKGQNEHSTSKIVSKSFKVSESTVKRDAKFAEGLDIVARTNPKLKTKILTGESKVKKADVQSLADARNPERLIIKNEADLFNKAKIIRAEIIDQVAADLKTLSKKKSAIQESAGIPMFLDKQDKLRKIKGMILSAINKAINEEDVKAIKELKKLVDRLEGVLFE